MKLFDAVYEIETDHVRLLPRAPGARRQSRLGPHRANDGWVFNQLVDLQRS